MNSDDSMNTTSDDQNATFWRPAVDNGTQWQPIPYATVNYARAVSYWIIFVVGIIGNLLVIAVGVIGHRKGNKGQTLVTRMFICCLAISDLGLMVTTTWSSALTAITPSWNYGHFFCKLSSLWTSLTTKVSVMMMSVIAVDRYLGLSQPGMMSYFSTRTAALLIVIIWVVVIVTGIPMFLWFDVVRLGPTLLRCMVSTETSSLDQALYSLIIMVILFFVPLAVTVASYVGIWHRMYFAKKKVSPSGQQQSHDNTASRKVARMCSIIVAVFFISWMPFQINLLYLNWGSNSFQALSLMSPLFILANMNSCINPIIYGFMWKPMRSTLEQIFCNSIFGRYLKTSTTQTTHITSVS